MATRLWSVSGNARWVGLESAIARSPFERRRHAPRETTHAKDPRCIAAKRQPGGFGPTGGLRWAAGGGLAANPNIADWRRPPTGAYAIIPPAATEEPPATVIAVEAPSTVAVTVTVKASVVAIETPVVTVPELDAGDWGVVTGETGAAAAGMLAAGERERRDGAECGGEDN